jgi:DNA-binding beta-propeller fold protein YncE
MRAALWDILWSRDYTRYAQLTNQSLNPPADWPLAERMRVYVRKDVAAQMLSLSLGAMMLPDNPEQADAYAAVQRPVSPTQVIATGSLTAPRGVATAADGSVYVADTGNSRLVKFDQAGKVVATWGSKTPDGQTPPAPGTFNEPWGVAVDAQGNVFVADTWNHRVQKLDANGKFLSEWSTTGPGNEEPHQLWGPRGIVVSSAGRVYVTDTGNKRVVVFDANGKFLFGFDTSGDGRLDEPVGIALGPDNNVVVADTWNSRVAVFSPDGKFITSWPVQGWLSDSLDNKPYLAVDAQGRVYVTDPEGYRIIVFSPAGQPLAAFGRYGTEEDAFALPTGLAIGADGTIWLADAGNNRVVRFEAVQP